MQSIVRTCAIALIHIPLHIRAFAISNCQFNYHFYSKDNFNCQLSIKSRDILTNKMAPMRAHSLCGPNQKLFKSFKISSNNIRFLTRMTQSDAFTEQQHLLDLKRSLQTLEPKYRYDVIVSGFRNHLTEKNLIRAYRSSIDEEHLTDKMKSCEAQSTGN